VHIFIPTAPLLLGLGKELQVQAHHTADVPCAAPDTRPPIRALVSGPRTALRPPLPPNLTLGVPPTVCFCSSLAQPNTQTRARPSVLTQIPSPSPPHPHSLLHSLLLISLFSFWSETTNTTSHLPRYLSSSPLLSSLSPSKHNSLCRPLLDTRKCRSYNPPVSHPKTDDHWATRKNPHTSRSESFSQVRAVFNFYITLLWEAIHHSHPQPSATLQEILSRSRLALIPSRRGRSDIPSWEAEQHLRLATLGYSTSPRLQYSVFGTFRSCIIVTTSTV
jgi:hypothetical protein